jgi:hypothetical protein
MDFQVNRNTKAINKLDKTYFTPLKIAAVTGQIKVIYIPETRER